MILRQIAHQRQIGHQSDAETLEMSAFVGLVCASLQLFGPDHLCTLMSLGSSSSASWPTLRIGAAWGLAHSMGTVIVCMALQFLRGRGYVDTDAWEHYGDYFIGISLVMCAAYFASRESFFLKEDANGVITVQGCDCHSGLVVKEKVGAVPDTMLAAEFPNRRNGKTKAPRIFSDAFSCPPCNSGSSFVPRFEDDPEMPLLGSKAATSAQVHESKSDSLPWLGGAMLGLVQGLCCPMALVSINLLAYTPTTAAAAMFIVTYSAASVVGAALFSLLWFQLTHSALSKFISPRAVFRGSCAFTLAFGIFWIVANHFGALESFDFSQTLMPRMLTAVPENQDRPVIDGHLRRAHWLSELDGSSAIEVYSEVRSPLKLVPVRSY